MRRYAKHDSYEREEKEVERLVRKSPTKKPPRIDKERGRVKVEDPDLDQTDPDLSMNYKDIGGSVAVRYVGAFEYDPDADTTVLEEEEGDEFPEEESLDEDEDDIEIKPLTRPPTDETILEEARRLYEETVPVLQKMLEAPERTEAEGEAIRHALRMKTEPFPPEWKREAVFHEGILTLKARYQLRKHMRNWDIGTFVRNINYIKERRLNDSLLTGRDDHNRYYEVVLELMAKELKEFQERDFTAIKSLDDLEARGARQEELEACLRRTGTPVLKELRTALKKAVEKAEGDRKEKLEILLTILRGTIMARGFQKKAQYRGTYQYGDGRAPKYVKKDALDLDINDYVTLLKRAYQYLKTPFISNDLLAYDLAMACSIAMDYAIFEDVLYDKKVDAPTYEALAGILKRQIERG